MRQSSELQIGKAGEYIVCADAIMKGMICYPSEQGLPYDIVIDSGSKLLRCQVKTTLQPRVIPQRSKETYAYIFNIKRHGKNNTKIYTLNEVDIFALVELENRTVAYLKNEEMPSTINLRVEKYRGTYYDEKGAQDFKEVRRLLETTELSQVAIADKLGIGQGTVNRMAQDDYEPYLSDATYFSDLYRDREWFNEL